ncbi:MAG: hypothetical protein ILP22_10715, partial [Oscillospiraceae bacterium]|nr:hypothetical protein [Oscillospiraceae bacterium]
YTTMKKAYNAGDSVTDFIKMYFDCFESESPFYKDYYLKQFKGSDFKMFDIYTTEDIAIEPGNGPRVLHLMMDLSKVYAVREFKGTAHFQLTMKGRTIQVEKSKFVFDITRTGKPSNTGSGSSTIENTEPDGQPDIWVNGKDNKKDSIYYKTTSRTLSDLISELPDGCKYIVSVTGTDIDDVANAFGTGGKAKKSDVAKASIKAKDGLVNVSAGKKAGTARIWVATFNSKEKKIVESKYFDVAVGTAPKKMYLTQYGKAEKAEAVKSIMLNQGDSEKVFVNAEGTVLSAYTSFTWDSSKDTDGLLDISVSEDAAQSATITLKSAPSDGKVKKIGISVINNESGKKVTLSVLVSNAVQSIDGLDKAYALGSAADAAVEETLDYSLVCSSKDGPTTDKIKVYVTTALEEGEGYTLTNGKKFTQSSSSKSKIKVTYKDGVFTLKAPKKTADGSKVRVLIVATHADKTVEVFESGVITVGPEKKTDSN